MLVRYDNASQWKGDNSTPASPKTPEPMVTKIGTGDDVGTGIPFHYHPIRGFCSPTCARVHLNDSIFYSAAARECGCSYASAVLH